MKRKLLFTALVVLVSITTANSQSVNMIYDHNDVNLNHLYSLPYQPNHLMVVSGYDNTGVQSNYYYHPPGGPQLVEMTFNNVDTIWGLPKFQGNSMFFVGSLNGLGKEVVMYDGNSTVFFDFNNGALGSDPEIIEFNGEIFIIATVGANRQLLKYDGGTNILQLTFETEGGVEDFIAHRGNDYIYTTYNTLEGKWIKVTSIVNGIVSINQIAPTSIQEEVGDVLIVNNEVWMLSYFYSVIDASYRVDKIDASNIISTQYYETGGIYSSGKLLELNNELLYYRTEPGHAEVLNITVQGQEYIYASLDPNQYNYIANHVVANNRLFLIGDTYVTDATSGTAIDIISDGEIIQTNPGLVTSSSFFLYEISPVTGQQSGIIEVGLSGNDFLRYDVSTEGGYMAIVNPMVEHDGNVKFIFREEGTPSTDIYELNSVLSLQEDQLSEFTVYPNPVQSKSVLKIESETEMNALLENLSGQRVKEFKLVNGITEITIANLEAGIYFLKTESTSHKIIVTN